jgi:hypothetical protein
MHKFEVQNKKMSDAIKTQLLYSIDSTYIHMNVPDIIFRIYRMTNKIIRLIT